MSSPTEEREEAIRAIAADWDKAIGLARAVSDPWFRCQALGWVARFARGDRVEAVAREALHEAGLGRDGYSVVGASAWPIRALIERDGVALAGAEADRLAAYADTISHPVSRADGLFLLWAAVFPGGAGVCRGVEAALVNACAAANSWKAGCAMRDVVLIVAGRDRQHAEHLLSTMRESNYRRQAARGLAAGTARAVRPFFWARGN